MIRKDLFVHTLNNARMGLLADEASDALHACVEAARETGKPATLTLTLTLKANGATGQLHLHDQIKTRLPARLPALDKGATILFITPEGNLQREDPRQLTLAIKPVVDDRPVSFKTV